MNKLTIKNTNPRNERIGDCVIRAFASLLENEIGYDEIKKEIVKYGTCPKSYERYETFERFAKEANLVRITLMRSRHEIKTFNQAIVFSKQFKVDLLCLANNHMVHVSPENGLVDTWDSRGKRIQCLYIHRDDAELLGLETRISSIESRIDLIDNRKIAIIREGKGYKVSNI